MKTRAPETVNTGNILVLSAGRRVELLRAFKQNIADLGFQARILAADMRPHLSAACQIADDSFTLPKATDPEFPGALLTLCHQHNIALVVPTIDPELEVLSQKAGLFQEQGITITISTPELIAESRDKRKTGSLFNSLGIGYPQIMSRDNLSFPCFCKPYDGSRSVGAKPLMEASDLLSEDLENPKNIFIELVPETYSEYTVDAYYNNSHRLCGLVPRERLEVRDGEVSKGITRKNFVYHYLIQRLDHLPGARGCITFQFFVNHTTQDIKGLEINPRFGGGYPLTHSSGAEFTRWMLKEYWLQEVLPMFDDWQDNLLMLRYDAAVFNVLED